MDTIEGTVKNGHIIPDRPVHWPDGCRVRIELEEAIRGTPEDDQSDTPEAIAQWIAEFDAILPWQMTAAEEAEWQATR